VRRTDTGDAPAGLAPDLPDAPDAPASGGAAASGVRPRADAAAPAEPARRSVARRLLRFVLLVVVPALALAGGAAWWLAGGGYAETDNAYVKADKIPVSAEVSGTVRTVLVRENQAVAAGEPLFRLDDAPFRVAVAKAEAKVAQARTDVAALKATYRTKQAEIALARTRQQFARRDEERLADLAARNFISAARLDEARQSTELAAQQTVAAERELGRIAETLGGGPDVPVERHPAVLGAQAELMQARLDLSRIEVKAPVAGTVSRPPKPGQFVGAGSTALALVADGTLWIEANFAETDLTFIRPDQPVTISIDTYPGREWRGAVDSLAPATGAEFAVIPPQNATGNWVKIAQRVPVRIRIEPQADAPPLRAGLSARVAIRTGHQRRLADLLP
jgi:membrane fusion protein (multidrug efflux system)